MDIDSQQEKGVTAGVFPLLAHLPPRPLARAVGTTGYTHGPQYRKRYHAASTENPPPAPVISEVGPMGDTRRSRLLFFACDDTVSSRALLLTSSRPVHPSTTMTYDAALPLGPVDSASTARPSGYRCSPRHSRETRTHQTKRRFPSPQTQNTSTAYPPPPLMLPQAGASPARCMSSIVTGAIL